MRGECVLVQSITSIFSKMPDMSRHDDLPAGAHAVPPPTLASTLPEERFDRITRIAAQSFDMPMALFTLSDAEYCCCKSQVGLTPAQLSSLVGLCRDDLHLQSVLVVNDAPADARFAATSIVAANPGLRFYAGAPVRDPDGAVIGALWLLDHRPRHIDPDKLALFADLAHLLERELVAGKLEHRLVQQESGDAAFRSLLDYIPEGVLMLGADGTILACNALAERMYAATADGLVGRSSSDFIAEDPVRLREALRAGEREQLQAMARRLDGSAFLAEFSVKLLDASDASRYVLAVRDISLRKEQEGALQAAHERRRKYFVTATHELRTPMASVLGFSELLLKRDFDPVERQEMVGIIHRQTSRLVNLVNEMLDLARIESGGRDALHLVAQDAGAVLEQTLSGLDGLGATHRIRRVVAPDLPPVLADAAKLQQALTNIISNAIKYSADPSEIRVSLFATTLDGAAAVGVRVADGGIGMTPDQKAKVFEAFYRAHEDQDNVGTGLGMTIFKEIIDLHHGVIQIESTPGIGTEVTLLLPAAAGTA